MCNYIGRRQSLLGMKGSMTGDTFFLLVQYYYLPGLISERIYAACNNSHKGNHTWLSIWPGARCSPAPLQYLDLHRQHCRCRCRCRCVCVSTSGRPRFHTCSRRANVRIDRRCNINPGMNTCVYVCSTYVAR